MAVEISRQCVPEIENVLDISGIEESLNQFEENYKDGGITSRRDFGVGEVASLGGGVVAIVAYFQQVKLGQTAKTHQRKKCSRKLV